MRLVSTYTHGIADYFVGSLLLAGPWLFGFVNHRAETWIFILLGLATFLYSLLTDYELGAIRVIPMPIHLGLDLVAGIFLAVSPWLFGFSTGVYLPHLCLGILEILVVSISQTKPGPRSHGIPDHIPLR
jgi:hypothetical protein